MLVLLLHDINPFIRFASKISISTISGRFKSKDHRLFYVNNGDEEIKINNKIYPLKTNALFIIPAGTEYEFILKNQIFFTSINFDFTQIRRRNDIPFSPIDISSNSDTNDFIEEFFLDELVLNNTIYIEHANFALYQLEQILNLFRVFDHYSITKSSALLKCLIIDIVKTIHSQSNDIINQIINYIYQNYKNDMSSQDISEQFGYHPYYLNKIFTKKIGTTLHKYLINYRIKISEQLLIETNHSISQIAQDIGFNSTTIFII